MGIMVNHPRQQLKKSASFVLASLRGSTYRSVRLASSLAAALLGGLFELLAKVFSR
jgi:class 3 adenylate cyclase